MAGYAIRGGKAGYDRLRVLARDRWPETERFLKRIGIRPGLRCVDLGCGGGQVALELAALVEPSGAVTGVDMDPVNVELARSAAADRGFTNVEFNLMNLDDWNEPDAYDVVFSRFVFQHLRAPMGLLLRMWAAVRVHGVVAVEDADFDGWCCHPPNDGFDFFVRTYAEVQARRGVDHAMARKLYALFLDAGLPDPQVSLSQSLRQGEAKALPLLTLEATRDAIVAEGVASPAEVDAALASLARFTDDPATLIGGPRNFQVWARRPPVPFVRGAT
jgi:SAM-dependent methyltransferase